jgi:hypothetical protein
MSAVLARLPGACFHFGKITLLTTFQEFGLADPITRALK